MNSSFFIIITDLVIRYFGPLLTITGKKHASDLGNYSATTFDVTKTDSDRFTPIHS